MAMEIMKIIECVFIIHCSIEMFVFCCHSAQPLETHTGRVGEAHMNDIE